MSPRTRIAVAALVRDGRVLLGHRHPARRWYPDCWDLVGGHVEPGEAPHQAIVRECREELGVRVHDPVPMLLSVIDPTLDVHAFLVRSRDSPCPPGSHGRHRERRAGRDDLISRQAGQLACR